MAYRNKERYFKYLENNYSKESYREPKTSSEKEWFKEWFETTEYPDGNKFQEAYSKLMIENSISWDFARIILRIYLDKRVDKILNAHYDGTQLTIWETSVDSNVKLRLHSGKASETYDSILPVTVRKKERPFEIILFSVIVGIIAFFTGLGLCWVLKVF